MRRDLLVSAYTPDVGSGGGVRTYGVVRALAALGPVDMLYSVFGRAEAAPAYTSIAGLELHPVTPSRGARRALAYARARATGVPRNFARGVSPELARAAARMADDEDRGRVIADGPVVAAALLGLARRRPVVYNAHNVESTFRHALHDSGLGSPERLAAFERRVIEAAAESWMVSERDMEAARVLAPAARLRYVPNVVDVAAIRPVPDGRGEHRALFVGDFRYQPNRDGLRFVLDEVLPRVWERLDDARLQVVGRGLDDVSHDDARVEIAGFVDDLPGAYAAAACVIVPLLAGGGSPLKFVEAMAYGKTVVATPVAAAGLEARPGEHYREAEGPDAFAAALADVLAAGAPDLGRRARALAEERYSIESLSRRLAP